jgi:translation initiation factor IF-2
MNNGKVRIYELSKELNLENKDLLGICEGLNIVVKSHSSSISEAEADQIIKAANEKFPDRQKAPRQILTDKVESAAVPKSDASKSPQTNAPGAANSVSQSAPPRPTEPTIATISTSSSQCHPSRRPTDAGGRECARPSGRSQQRS